MNFIFNKNKFIVEDSSSDFEIKIDNTELTSVSLFNEPIHAFRKIPGLKLKIYQLENSIVYKYGKRLFIQRTTNQDFETNLGIQPNMNKEKVLNITKKKPTKVNGSAKYILYI